MSFDHNSPPLTQQQLRDSELLINQLKVGDLHKLLEKLHHSKKGLKKDLVDRVNRLLKDPVTQKAVFNYLNSEMSKRSNQSSYNGPNRGYPHFKDVLTKVDASTAEVKLKPDGRFEMLKNDKAFDLSRDEDNGVQLKKEVKSESGLGNATSSSKKCFSIQDILDLSDSDDEDPYVASSTSSGYWLILDTKKMLLRKCLLGEIEKTIDFFLDMKAKNIIKEIHCTSKIKSRKIRNFASDWHDQTVIEKGFELHGDSSYGFVLTDCSIFKSFCEESIHADRIRCSKFERMFSSSSLMDDCISFGNEIIQHAKVERDKSVVTKITASSPKLEAISRKRCLSNASTINEDVSPTKCRQPQQQEPSSTGKPARKTARARLVDSSESVGSSPSRNEEPTLGWCSDENTLKRRTEEIERVKEKSVYQKYNAEVPIRDRMKGVHPRTPNKIINYSQRKWNTEIGNWERSLYDWAGEEPSNSVNTFGSYTSSDEVMSGKKKENLENTPVDFDIQVRPEADNKASLLDKLDIDSQMGMTDEGTLKASNPKFNPSAPTDFSNTKL